MAVNDTALLAWIDHQPGTESQQLQLLHGDRQLPLQRIAQAALAEHFGFVYAPSK